MIEESIFIGRGRTLDNEKIVLAGDDPGAPGSRQHDIRTGLQFRMGLANTLTSIVTRCTTSLCMCRRFSYRLRNQPLGGDTGPAGRTCSSVSSGNDFPRFRENPFRLETYRLFDPKRHQNSYRQGSRIAVSIYRAGTRFS